NGSAHSSDSDSESSEDEIVGSDNIDKNQPNLNENENLTSKSAIIISSIGRHLTKLERFNNPKPITSCGDIVVDSQFSKPEKVIIFDGNSTGCNGFPSNFTISSSMAVQYGPSTEQ